MRSITPVIAVILMIVITIGLAATTYLFLTSHFQNIISKAEEQTEFIRDVSLLQITNIYWYDYRDGLVLELRFDDCGNLGQNLQDGYKLKDYSGNDNDGIAYNGPKCVKGVIGKALEFDGGDDYVNTTIDEISTSTGSKITVIFWMNWYGKDSSMPIGFHLYDLWIKSSSLNPPKYSFGFNTAGGNIEGLCDIFTPVNYGNKWLFITAIFTSNLNPLTNNKLYLDGKEIQLQHCFGTTYNRTLSTAFRVSGWPTNTGYKFKGILDELRIYNKALDEETIKNLFYRIHLIVYNPSDKPIELNNTYFSIGDCIFKLIYNETFITNKDRSIIYPNEQIVLKVTNIKCHLDRYKEYDICLISRGNKICDKVKVR